MRNNVIPVVRERMEADLMDDRRLSNTVRANLKSVKTKLTGRDVQLGIITPLLDYINKNYNVSELPGHLQH
jgi:hypothetical protein